MIGWSIITSHVSRAPFSSVTTMAFSSPLPSRPNTSANPPVWHIDNTGPVVETPSAAKCDSSTRQDGICCKELIEDERTLVDPDVVRDV